MPALKEKIKLFLSDYEQDVRRLAEELLDEPLPEDTQNLFSEYESCGNRVRYEKIYFGRRKFLSVYGLICLIDPEEKYRKKLAEVLKGICEEECWALPAHVNTKADPGWRIHIDLFASETGQTLAEMLEWFGDFLPEGLKKEMADEISRRILIPFLGSEVPYDSWEQNTNNWNAVCCGNVGSTILYRLPEGEEREKAMDRICHALRTYYIPSFGEEGVCEEGIGYWVYGFSYFMLFAKQLEKIYPEKSLLKDSHVERIAYFQQKCYFPKGRTISFSDGDSHSVYPMGLTCCLAMDYPKICFPDPDYAQSLEKDSCWRWYGISRSFLDTRKYLETIETGSCPEPKALPETGSEYLKEAEWAVFRGAGETALIGKGGNNGESHNHNDVGSFYYLAGDDALLDDLGAGEYTRDYFHEKRYEIFCNNGFGHNIPIINGCAEKEGKEYAASFCSGEDGTLTVEFAKAYGLPEVKSVKRTVRLEADGKLVLQDEIRADAVLSVTENLITRCPVEVKDGGFVIRGKDHTGILTVENGRELTVKEQQHSNHAAMPETVYVMQWKVPEEKNHVFCSGMRLALQDMAL